MNNQRIPQTDSIQELAQFWDSHDLTDFERKTLVQIHLQPVEVEAVKEAARLRGMNYVDLLREWVLEKVHIS